MKSRICGTHRKEKSQTRSKKRATLSALELRKQRKTRQRERKERDAVRPASPGRKCRLQGTGRSRAVGCVTAQVLPAPPHCPATSAPRPLGPGLLRSLPRGTATSYSPSLQGDALSSVFSPPVAPYCLSLRSQPHWHPWASSPGPLKSSLLPYLPWVLSTYPAPSPRANCSSTSGLYLPPKPQLRPCRISKYPS